MSRRKKKEQKMSDEKKDEQAAPAVEVTEDPSGSITVTTHNQTGGLTAGRVVVSRDFDIPAVTRNEEPIDHEYPALFVGGNSIEESVAAANGIGSGDSLDGFQVRHRKCNGKTAQVVVPKDAPALHCGFCGGAYPRDEFMDVEEGP